MSRTRPTVRAVVLALLVVFVYGAGANIGSNAVILIAAGIAVGGVWSVALFLRRVARVTVNCETTPTIEEGSTALPATVTVPSGITGVVAVRRSDDKPTMLAAARVAASSTQPRTADRASGGEWALLASLDHDVPRCPDCDRPLHWTPLPVMGGTSRLGLPLVACRGPQQSLTIDLHLADVLGLVRRRMAVAGPTVDVVPTAGTAKPFRASSHEDDANEQPSHALSANGAPGADLRTWRPGEPIRAIHWPASLRTDQLLLRPRSPETSQRCTLGIADGTWTRAELDARCREVWATATRLAAMGVEVEIAADGRTMPVGSAARRWLASLPPNATVGPRALGDGGASSQR